MMGDRRVEFILNGDPVEVTVKPSETLLETLRERFELTGTKEGCGLGACGTCTVLVDGLPTRSCIVLTVEVEGAKVTTIEGIADGTTLDRVQEAFMENGAVQCGFCTPGMILTAKGLLKRNPHPDRPEIIRSISSNLCRCTGYKKIVEAVEMAASSGGKPD
ncbi:MAG: (2Fe-2S)-binding protein [Deltaproteobacteria bacterium]|jgi:aerobic-type carbon monoxide dehydrogenase small subunit (CoxS/CutS family)